MEITYFAVGVLIVLLVIYLSNNQSFTQGELNYDFQYNPNCMYGALKKTCNGGCGKCHGLSTCQGGQCMPNPPIPTFVRRKFHARNSTAGALEWTMNFFNSHYDNRTTVFHLVITHISPDGLVYTDVDSLINAAELPSCGKKLYTNIDDFGLARGRTYAVKLFAIVNGVWSGVSTAELAF